MQNVAQEMEQRSKWATKTSVAHLACYSISCTTFCVPTCTQYFTALLLSEPKNLLSTLKMVKEERRKVKLGEKYRVRQKFDS